MGDIRDKIPAYLFKTPDLCDVMKHHQRTAYFHLGDLIEVGSTIQIFTNPRHQLTEDYITGRFG